MCNRMYPRKDMYNITYNRPHSLIKLQDGKEMT